VVRENYRIVLFSKVNYAKVCTFFIVTIYCCAVFIFALFVGFIPFVVIYGIMLAIMLTSASEELSTNDLKIDGSCFHFQCTPQRVPFSSVLAINLDITSYVGYSSDFAYEKHLQVEAEFITRKRTVRKNTHTFKEQNYEGTKFVREEIISFLLDTEKFYVAERTADLERDRVVLKRCGNDVEEGYDSFSNV